MSKEYTPEQRHAIYQSIWGLRNKMAAIHGIDFPTTEDATNACWAVHAVFDSKGYAEVEEQVKASREE